MQKSGKLELTWVGKNEEKVIEPRILVEDKNLSYGDPNSENMLIHGDNLIALQALQQDYAGKIKCIYIDPPFNTGQAFEHYDDNIEHSIWLDLMYNRVKLLHSLLADDGVIAIEIDDNEMPYLRIILDEVFGRNKFVASISVKSNSISGAKTAHKDKTILRNKDNILVYKKGDELTVYPQYVKKDKWDTHYTHFIDFSTETPKISSLKDVLIKNGIIETKDKITENLINNEKFYEFIIKNKKSIYQLVSSLSEKYKKESRENPDTLIEYLDDNGQKRFAYNGRRLSFIDSSIIEIDGKDTFVQLLGDLWIDIDFQNTQNEGGVSFPQSKKPEALVRRVIEMFTLPGEYVLDSFLGSGTTAAVAHKLGRNYIGVELGDHAYSHCKTRLDSVIDGEQGGISKKINWQGGGGYHFYELAPSLLVKHNKLPIYQVNPEYTFEMLCEAICKLEGFRYKPDGVYHGHSSEQRFIHITNEYINSEYVKSISANLGDGQSLLIYGTKIQSGMRLPDNIEIKKIPKDLLEKCDFESEVR